MVCNQPNPWIAKKYLEASQSEGPDLSFNLNEDGTRLTLRFSCNNETPCRGWKMLKGSGDIATLFLLETSGTLKMVA